MKLNPADIPYGDSVVMEYGIRVDDETVANVQIQKSRQLYNNLVAVMQDTVNALQAFVIGQAGPEALAIKEAIEVLTDSFNAAKAVNDEPAMQTIAEARRAKWGELSAILKDVRKKFKAEIQSDYLSRIGRNSTCETYKLRSAAVANGLGWGTANAVLDAALQAFKKSFAIGKAPRFAQGSTITQDCLTLQFTAAGGISVDKLLDGSSGDLSLNPGNACGRRKYGEFRFRLGAAKDEAYATGTWQYHRPIPQGSCVALARLVRRRVGPHYKWAIQLLVKPPEPIRIEVKERAPLATVHFGWSYDVGGRRVAGVSDAADPGLARLIALPPGIEEALNRATNIQSVRDTQRDAVVVRVKALETPKWASETLVEVLSKLRHIRPQDVSANRLHYVCKLFDGQAPDWLEAWRKQDRLQWQDQTHIAKRARNARKTFYREVAINLCRNYSALVIEPLDLSGAAVKVNEVTGEKTEFAKKARAGRVVAAVYEFESAIRWAATKAGTALLELVGKTASMCSICGGEHVSHDEGNYQTINCADCGAALDRKLNGAALAWQFSHSRREEYVEDFWITHLKKREDVAAKKAEKLSKMADGRRKTRTSSDDKSL